ncbi:hypothetical protein HMPREF9104_01032 [Lentilactobacillus kisonensis F0435]|uniref:Uncharacterized protein n=1 Tax=Lentilactobacillus kisonensis F0435 TaxID=797516 RepID=H1LEK6_9LACO|nr:hypothetical protein HMPREF9104_01032 [Lentilactobacillus kisonensis F0435]
METYPLVYNRLTLLTIFRTAAQSRDLRVSTYTKNPRTGDFWYRRLTLRSLIALLRSPL